MLKVHLKNADDTERHLIVFPKSERTQRQALNGKEENVFEIKAVESPLDGLDRHMAGMMIRPRQGLHELEFLDRHIEGMTEKEKTVFQAAMEIEKPQNMAELINLACNLDKFALYADAASYEELGRHVLEKVEVPADAAPYLDYRAAGEQYAGTHAGCFTGQGYVVRTGEAIEPVYTEGCPPTPGYDKSCVIRAWLQTPFYAAGHYNLYPLSLPASEERLALAAKNLGVEELDEKMVSYISSPVRELESFLPFSKKIQEMNAFAGLLAEKGILGNTESREKLFAALEAEVPADMSQAMEIAEGLGNYIILPDDVKTAADYAYYFLEEAQIYVDEAIEPFLDYELLGKCQMNKDGVVQTEYGMIRREDRRIPQLTEELTELKLFSPLKAAMYFYDEEWGGISDQPEEIGAEELCGYKGKILDRIGQEHLEEEGERGLAVYIGNQLLKRKVFSMNPTVESWKGELWGVLEVKTRGELSAQELDGLMEEWEGQESDGWGEGFEQRKIETKEGELYVSFWNSGKDFFIKTEQELKQEQTCGLGMRME